MTYDIDENDCCEDDWSVWLRVETWAWAFLLLVQMSMVVFLVIHGRKEKSFRQAFYVFFVAVTIVDCALALLRPSREDATLFGTKYDESFIVQKDPRTHEEQVHSTIRGSVNKIVTNAVVPALGHAQPLFLTAIAVNRFTAFAFPMKHASMWRTRTVLVVTVLLTLMSVTLGATTTVAAATQKAAKCWGASRKQRAELFCYVEHWLHESILLPTTLITLTSAICCIASFVLNVGSIAMLIALRTTGRLQRKGPELQLFAHTLWMFVLQLLLAIHDVVYIVDNPIGHGLGLGFTVFESYWFDDSARPLCSVWYRLMVGELVLREKPHFSVRTLELCMFAFSGSIFLLIISGNVRNAYFAFYFKWACFKKKRGQHSTVNVIAVTPR